MATNGEPINGECKLFLDPSKPQKIINISKFNGFWKNPKELLNAFNVNKWLSNVYKHDITNPIAYQS